MSDPITVDIQRSNHITVTSETIIRLSVIANGTYVVFTQPAGEPEFLEQVKDQLAEKMITYCMMNRVGYLLIERVHLEVGNSNHTIDITTEFRDLLKDRMYRAIKFCDEFKITLKQYLDPVNKLAPGKELTRA